MAYTEDENPLGLDMLTELADDDVILIGDQSDPSGKPAKAITKEDLITDLGIGLIKVTTSDTTPEALSSKIQLTSLDGSVVITQSVVNPAGDETLKFDLSAQSSGGAGGSGSGKPKSYQIRHLIEQGENIKPVPVTGYTDQEFYAIGVRDQNQSPVSVTLIVEAPGLGRTLIDTSTIDADFTQVNGYVVLEGFLYILAVDPVGLASRVYRYTLSNLATAPTLMTIAGQAFSTVSFTMTSDGTNFFFTADAGSSADEEDVAEYTISGTTLTYVATVTLAGTPSLRGIAVLSDGTYVIMDTTSLKTYDDAGALVDTFTAYSNNYVILTNYTDTIYIGTVSTLEAPEYSEFVKIDFPGEAIVDGANSFMPVPVYISPSLSTLQLTVPTTGYFGKVYIADGIELASQLAFAVTAVGAAGAVKIALYTEDGRQRLLNLSATVSSTGLKIFTFTPQSIPSGFYYIGITIAASVDVTVRIFSVSASQSIFNNPSGKPIFSGTATITSGTLPSTLDVDNLTPSTGAILITRFDQ